jgi:transposase InsO family protein
LCDLFGKSRQAYYQHSRYVYKEEVKAEILLQLVGKERKMMPRIGGRKLLLHIQPHLPAELYLGRDSFFEFLREQGLLIRKRRYRVRTTYSNHWLHKYPNLIKEFEPEKAHQLWVSDITYIETKEGFGYLNLITDAYSRKIIGWDLGATLEAKHTVKALQMAINQMPKGIKGVIHHSDRGVQYCCSDYVKVLNKNHFQISMTENSDPRENAVAERVNGILKDEWLNQMKLTSLTHATNQLEQIIMIYNQNRLHSSLDMKTPEYAHNQSGKLKKHWKNYYQINNIEQEQKINSFI